MKDVRFGRVSVYAIDDIRSCASLVMHELWWQEADLEFFRLRSLLCTEEHEEDCNRAGECKACEEEIAMQTRCAATNLGDPNEDSAAGCQACVDRVGRSAMRGLQCVAYFSRLLRYPVKKIATFSGLPASNNLVSPKTLLNARH